jgi:hypothetical protein
VKNAQVIEVLGSDATIDGLAAALLTQARAVNAELIRAQQQAQAPTPAPVSVADELAKLAGLRQSGVLSNAEFEAEKSKLLGGS